MKLVIILFALLSTAFSQNIDSILNQKQNNFEKKSLRARITFFGSLEVFNQYEKYKPGMSGGKLNDLYKENELAKNELRLYKNNKIAFTVIYSIGLATMVSSIFLIDINDMTPSNTALFGGLAISIVSVKFSMDSFNSLLNSLWEYNRNLYM